MNYVVGDTPILEITCREDGDIIDLSPGTMVVSLRHSLNGAVATESLTMDKTGDGSTGIVTRKWLASELSAAGTIRFEVYLTDTSSGTIVNTSQRFTREVRNKV